MTEHHQLDGHEFEQAPGAGDGQGSLACWMESVGQMIKPQQSQWWSQQQEHGFDLQFLPIKEL